MYLHNRIMFSILKLCKIQSNLVKFSRIFVKFSKLLDYMLLVYLSRNSSQNMTGVSGVHLYFTRVWVWVSKLYPVGGVGAGGGIFKHCIHRLFVIMSYVALIE